LFASAFNVVNATATQRLTNRGFETGSIEPFLYLDAFVTSSEAYSGTYSCWVRQNGWLKYVLYPYVTTDSITAFGVYAKTPNVSATFKWYCFYTDGTNSSSGNAGVDSTQWWSMSCILDNGYTANKTMTAFEVLVTDNQVKFDNFTLMAETLGNMEYEHTWNPEPFIEYTPFNIVLNQSVTYNLNYYITYNGNQTWVSGSYTVSSSGTWSLFTDMDSASLHPVLGGSITNGNFSFNFAPRSAPASVYEKIEVRMTTYINGTNYQVYPEVYVITWWNPEWTPPTPTPETQIPLAISLIVPMLFLFLPALLLGKIGGIAGLIAGLCIGDICLVSVGWFPIWTTFFIGLAIIVLIFFGRGRTSE